MNTKNHIYIYKLELEFYSQKRKFSFNGSSISKSSQSGAFERRLAATCPAD